LRNDAVINHFTGWTLTVENVHEVVYEAVEPAVGAMWPLVCLPKHKETVLLEDGREQRFFRWTIWTKNAATKAPMPMYSPSGRKLMSFFVPIP
jgi:hypothetical protein